MFDIEKLKEKLENNLDVPISDREVIISNAQLLIDVHNYFLDNFEVDDDQLQVMVGLNMDAHIKEVKDKLIEAELKKFSEEELQILTKKQLGVIAKKALSNFTKSEAQRESFVALGKFAEKHGFPRASEVGEKGNELTNKLKYYGFTK